MSAPLVARHPAGRPSSRTLVGVLVTDIVGSTSLRSRLGDLRAEQIRRGHERVLRAVVARHRGSVVQWRGDGILAAFASVSAAARAAVAIQQAAERENRRPDRIAELAVRTGVSGGEVTWTGPECDGAPVDEATAACKAAEGGQVLATAAALDLAGTRETLRTRSVGAGFHAIEWQPFRRAAERLGLPPALRTSGQLAFVGREGPLNVLREALAATLAAEPNVVILRGDAGIGKTRLAAELAREALAQGVVVLFGPAHDDLAVPYEPITRALRFWMERIDDLGERLGPRSGELVRLVPELAERVPDLPPPTQSNAETEQLRLYDALGEWLTTMALDDPILLVLDSLHCAPNPTFELLRHIFRILGKSRVLVVTSHRPSDERATALRQAAEEALGPGAVNLIDLAGLASADVEHLVVRTSGDDEAERLAGAIHLVTEGNPLHVSELLRRNVAESMRGTDLPATVGAALRANVDRVDASTRRVLEAGSVLGEEFDATLLGALLEDPDGSYEALEVAERAGFVRELDRRALRYRFSHALTRDIVYGGIGAARAARLHERAGILLEQRRDPANDAQLPDLARHFAAAAALGHHERAARYAEQAARRALAQYANEQAADLFAEALRLQGEKCPPRERCELTIGRGEALRRMGDPAYRPLLIGAAEQARGLGNGDLMGRALLATYRGTFTRALQVDGEQVERLRGALELCDEEHRPLRARLLALLAVEMVWAEDRSASRAISDRAVAVAGEVRDDALLAEVLAHRQWTVFHPLADRLATTAALAELATKSPDPLLRFESSGSEVFTYLRSGDRPGLERAIGTMRGLAAEIDQPLVRWMFLIRESMVAVMEARFADAEALIAEGYQLGRRTAQPDIMQQHAIQRFWLDFEIEPPDSARTRIAPLVKTYENLPRLAWAPIAFGCCERGLAALASPIVARLAEDGPERIPVDMLWLWELCLLAACAAQAGDVSLAGALYERLEPSAGEHANMMFATLGSVSRYLGLLCRALGRWDEAETRLRAAERSNQALGAVTWLARTRLDLAELRFERFGPEDAEAREALARASAAASELRLPSVGERAQRLASRVSAAP